MENKWLNFVRKYLNVLVSLISYYFTNFDRRLYCSVSSKVVHDVDEDKHCIIISFFSQRQRHVTSDIVLAFIDSGHKSVHTVPVLDVVPKEQLLM